MLLSFCWDCSSLQERIVTNVQESRKSKWRVQESKSSTRQWQLSPGWCRWFCISCSNIYVTKKLYDKTGGFCERRRGGRPRFADTPVLKCNFGQRVLAILLTSFRQAVRDYSMSEGPVRSVAKELGLASRVFQLHGQSSCLHRSWGWPFWSLDTFSEEDVSSLLKKDDVLLPFQKTFCSCF